jgi:subtilisin family serine protease
MIFSYPAAYDLCISIAAVQKKDGFPVAVFSNSNDQVDYSGIGVDVTSFKPGGGFQTMSGTSMACPHACGLMACLVQKYGGTAGLRSKLTASHTVDIGAEGIDNATGIGFLTYLTGKGFDKLLPRKKKGGKKNGKKKSGGKKLSKAVAE